MVLLMEKNVSLLQSQFDYSTDSYHSGTEATRFHVISHISHIISSLSIIIHFQQKHGCFPQLSSPISQEKTGCAGETGWSSTTGGWWIQWDGSLGRVEWGTLFCYIGYTCLLDLLGKNVVSVFRLFFCLKDLWLLWLVRYWSLWYLVWERLVQTDSCLYMAWRVQLWHEYTKWMLFLVDVHLFTNHASFMAPVQDVKNTDWDEICRLMCSAGRFTVKGTSPNPHQVQVLSV